MAKEKVSKKSGGSFEDALAEINAEFGVGSIMDGDNTYVKVSSFPSGVPVIDVALGARGIPQGRIIEFFGVESSGKTTLCLTVMAACQKHYFEKKGRNGKVVLIDAEHAFDPDWAAKIGIDLKKLAISQPDSGESAFKIMEKLILSNKVDLIVVDSVAALTPQAEIDGEVGDSHIGAQARLMSQGLRKIAGICSKTMTTVIFINQLREKIGVMFGNPETTPGGRALKFYASVRGSITKGSAIKDGEDTLGFHPTVKFIKNKVGKPFTSASFDICVGHPKRMVYGIDSIASLVDLAVQAKVVTKKGSHHSYNGSVLGNGMNQTRKFLSGNAELLERIREETYSKIFGDIDQNNIAPIPIDDELDDDIKVQDEIDEDDIDMASIDNELMDHDD